MAKIYERLLSTNILREKRRHSFDPQRVTLLGEDSICMVNLLETPRVIVFFFFDCNDVTCLVVSEENVLLLFCQASMKIKIAGSTATIDQFMLHFFFLLLMIDLLRLFQKRSFVLSSKQENHNVATIGTLLDQFMLSCK